MKKILFVGAPSSGKTTLAHNVFVELKKRGYKCEIIQELVRNEIQLNGVPELWEQYRFYMLQNIYENALPKNIDYAVVDSGTLMMFFYCFRKNNKNPRYKLLMQDMFKVFLDDLYSKRYDYIFYVPLIEEAQDLSNLEKENKNTHEDGTRFQTMEEIRNIDNHLKLHFTCLHGLDNVYNLQCSLKDRVDFVLNKILCDKNLEYVK